MKVAIFVFLFFLALSSQAAQRAVVITEGAPVYRTASFDGKVIGHFKAGSRVAISSKVFGAFFRVRFKQGVLGYIADTDVMPEGKKMGGDTSLAAAPKPKPARKIPIAQRVSVGLAAGSVSFKEIIGKAEFSEALTVFGVKATFPARFFDGPFQMEANWLTYFGVPNYYKTFLSGSASGTISFFDVLLDYALDQTENSVLYAGSGPMISWTSLRGETNGKKNDLSEMKAGASFVLGYGHWLGPVAFRIEAKYYIEESSYFGYQGAVQYDFF